MVDKKRGKGDIDDDLNLDDLDDLDADMDFGELEEIGDDRNPSSTGIAKELGKEAGSGFLDGLIRKTAKKSLPEEYDYHYTEAMDYVDLGKEVVGKSKSRIEKSLFKLGREVKKILPFQSKLLDGFLERYAEQNAAFKQQSEEELRNAGIESNLSGIFDKQLEVQKALEVRRAANDQVDKKERMVSTKLSIDLLTSIDNNAAQQTAFTLQIGKEYYKKSLELQFKSYYVQADMLKTMRDYYKGFSLQLDSVVKNTGLPEYVKLTNAERAGDMIRTKVFDSTFRQMFSNSKYVESIKNRMQKLVSDKLEGSLSGVDAFSDQLEMVNSAPDGPNGALRLLAGVGASLGGSSLGEKLADRISPKIKDKIKDNTVINAGAKQLDLLANSPTTFFANMREMVNRKRDGYQGENTPGEYIGSKLFGGLAELLSVTTPERMDYKVSADGMLSHKAPAIFDNKTHRSITEVIPMYLAKILKQNTDLNQMYLRVNQPVLGTSFKGSAELHYNYKDRNLVDLETLRAKTEKDVLASATGASRVKGVSSTILKQAKGTFGADKEANAAELKILNNKDNEKLLNAYLFTASKDDSIDKSFDSLVTNYQDNKAKSASLAKLLDQEPQLAVLLETLAKSKKDQNTENIDRSLGDLSRHYPIGPVKNLFKDTSKLAQSKVLNVLSDKQAEALARAFLRHITETGKDILPETTISGQAFRQTTTEEWELVKGSVGLFTAEVKKVLDTGGTVQELTLKTLFGLMNTSLRSGIERDPEVYQTLYDLNPNLGRVGALSIENLVEGRLGDFTKHDYVDVSEIKTITRSRKEELEQTRSGILDRFTNSKLFKDGLAFKADIDAAGKDPRKIFAAVGKHARLLNESISAKSKEYYDKATVKFAEIETLTKNLSDDTARRVIAKLTVKAKELETSVKGLIDTEKANITDKQNTLLEMKAKLVEVGNDPSAERVLEKEIKLVTTYHNNKIKVLDAILKSIQEQNTRLEELQKNSDGKPVTELIKEVRTILTTNIAKLRELVDKAKEAEEQPQTSV